MELWIGEMWSCGVVNLGTWGLGAWGLGEHISFGGLGTVKETLYIAYYIYIVNSKSYIVDSI